MRNYELVCIVQPDLDETAFNEAVERVKSWVSDAGGQIDKVDMWGKRKLAYLIRKQREGNYVLLNITLPTDVQWQRAARGDEVLLTQGQSQQTRLFVPRRDLI